MPKRTRNLNVRISDEELAMLAELAERDGLTSSDWLRFTIRRAHTKVFGATKQRTKKR
jgi:hypothetical protein